MPKLNSYLSFENGTCEVAFNFYRSVFGGEFLGKIFRMKDVPGVEGLSDKDKEAIIHIALPIGVDLLMGSDCVEQFGQKLIKGNNNYISVFPESREEADRLFYALSEGGNVEMPIENQFWGDYYGSFTDKFGICWAINYSTEEGYLA